MPHGSTEGSEIDPTGQDLDRAVDRTEGVQPGRRAFHATSGLLIAWLLASDPFGKSIVVPVLASALVLALGLDWWRLRSPTANVRFFKSLRWLASPRERDRVASSTWYLIGVLGALLIAPTSYAVSAILVLALADPAASVTGRLWGRRRVGTGTVLGTSVFFTVAFVIMALRHPLPLSVTAAALVSAAEVLRVPIDDNVVVPLSAALALMGLAVWLG